MHSSRLAATNMAGVCGGRCFECPKRAERIIARRGDDAGILLDPDSGDYYTPDDIGGRIWISGWLAIR